MPMYNNLSGPQMPGNGQSAGPNNAWGGGYAFDANSGIYGQQPQTSQQTQPRQNIQTDTRTFVNGKAGAEAFPMPQGVHMIDLWDSNGERVYIKGYDNNGFPRVIKDYDLVEHVEPEPPQYVTKEDIRAILEEMLDGRQERQNTSQRNDQRKGVEKR